MRTVAYTVAFAGVMAIAAVAFANPALMQKNKPGYPYPGTGAGNLFGEVALQEATIAESQLEGTVSHEAIVGKSLLPPTSDPKQLSPHPELDEVRKEGSRSAAESEVIKAEDKPVTLTDGKETGLKLDANTKGTEPTPDASKPDSAGPAGSGMKQDSQ